MAEGQEQENTAEVKDQTAAPEPAAATTAAPAATAPPVADAPVASETAAPIDTNPQAQAEFEKNPDNQNSGPLIDPSKIDLLNELYVSITIEIGRAQIKIRDLLSLTKGSIIELNKLAGEPVDVYANGKLIASGNIITANGKYCVRLASVSEKTKIGLEKNGN